MFLARVFEHHFCSQNPPIGELKFIVDGGYGAPSEHVEDFDVAMLIGAGIGITPFAAISKAIHFKQKAVRRMHEVST